MVTFPTVLSMLVEALKSSVDMIYISLQAEYFCAYFCLVITAISGSSHSADFLRDIILYVSPYSPAFTDFTLKEIVEAPFNGYAVKKFLLIPQPQVLLRRGTCVDRPFSSKNKKNHQRVASMVSPPANITSYSNFHRAPFEAADLRWSNLLSRRG